MIYAVIDTNVIVSALITKHHDAATYKVLSHVFSGDVVPLYNEDIIEEYRDVLNRKKFHLTSFEVNSIVDFFLSKGLHMDRQTFRPRLL